MTVNSNLHIFHFDRAGIVGQGAKTRPEEQEAQPLFSGNPGTGKASVTKIYASLLKELGVLPHSGFVETSGSALVKGTLLGMKSMLSSINNGGVLCIHKVRLCVKESRSLVVKERKSTLTEIKSKSTFHMQVYINQAYRVVVPR